MSWRAITEDDLLEAISGDELTGFREAALADGQDDPVEDSIRAVTDEVRGYVAGNSQNTVGPEGTIPERLMRAAVDRIIVRIGSRVLGSIFDEEGIRQQAAKDAKKLFEDAARGLFAVEQPDTAAEASEQNTMVGPSIRKPNRKFSNERQDGI